MTVKVSPTEEYRPIDSNRFAAAIHNGAGDWIVPPDEQVYATADPDLLDGPYNAAQYNQNASSGLTVRINTLEAFVGGHYCASDDAALTETDPNTGETRPIHDADLAANTAGQTVYLGVDHQRGDRIIIGTDAAFYADADPRVALYGFDTDADSVTGVTDRRPTGRRIDMRNDAYDAQSPRPDSEIRSVARAKEVENLDVDTSNLARTDAAETFEEPTYYQGTYNDFAGVAGRSDEHQRLAGTDGDLLIVVQRGAGRVQYAWNAYWDQSDDTWRSILANEPHALFGFGGGNPGPGPGIGNLTYAVAPANDGRDAAISWRRMFYRDPGQLVIEQEGGSYIPQQGSYLIHLASGQPKMRFEDTNERGQGTWDIGEDIYHPDGYSLATQFSIINQQNGMGLSISNEDGTLVHYGPNGEQQTINSF